MGKIVTVHYTNTKPSSTSINNGPPFGTTTSAASGFNNAISITGTKQKCIRIPFLPEGHVKQLVVKQSSGTSCAFTVELLMSVVPYPVGEAASNAAASGTLALFRIIPQQSVASAGTLDITPDYDVGWPFRNVDGDHTNNQRWVYLLINPTSASGTTVWDVFLMGESNHV